MNGLSRDDVVRWSQEAGIMPPDWGATENQWRSLETFAHLVAAAEREACAQVCEDEGERIDASWVSCAFAIRARGAP